MSAGDDADAVGRSPVIDPGDKSLEGRDVPLLIPRDDDAAAFVQVRGKVRETRLVAIGEQQEYALSVSRLATAAPMPRAAPQTTTR